MESRARRKTSRKFCSCEGAGGTACICEARACAFGGGAGICMCEARASAVGGGTGMIFGLCMVPGELLGVTLGDWKRNPVLMGPCAPALGGAKSWLRSAVEVMLTLLRLPLGGTGSSGAAGGWLNTMDGRWLGMSREDRARRTPLCSRSAASDTVMRSCAAGAAPLGSNNPPRPLLSWPRVSVLPAREEGRSDACARGAAWPGNVICSMSMLAVLMLSGAGDCKVDATTRGLTEPPMPTPDEPEPRFAGEFWTRAAANMSLALSCESLRIICGAIGRSIPAIGSPELFVFCGTTLFQGSNVPLLNAVPPVSTEVVGM